MCNALKKEKTEAEKKLAHIRGVRFFFSLPTRVGMLDMFKTTENKSVHS